MTTTPFVDFGRKTQYSINSAMGDVATMMPVLVERGQRYFPVSDYGECSGWVKQYFTCVKNGVVPILGMEAFVNDYRFEQDAENPEKYRVSYRGFDGEREGDSSEFSADELDYAQIDFPIDIFARTNEGYYNIIEIHNDAQINGFRRRPRTTSAFLASHGRGVVALLPTPYSEVCAHVYNGETDAAARKLAALREAFDDVYVEIPVVESEDYREINAEAIRWCRANGVPMVPVINAHFDTPEDEDVYPLFQQCVTNRKVHFEIEELPHRYAKTAEEVWDTFKRFHESEAFTEGTMRELMASLDGLCRSFHTLDLDTSPKTPHFPNSENELKEHARAGLARMGYDRKPNAQEYRDRLEYELDNICRAGFADYFILIERMFDWHVNKMHRLGSTGRGSAAGSLVLHCLGVTKIDPLHHGLLFERFLDASRLDEIINKGGKVSGADFPDVDNDMQSSCKEGVKTYFANVYGAQNICSVGTIGFLKVKSTLKKVGKAFGIDEQEINDLTTGELKDMEKDDDDLSLDELCEKFPSLAEFLGRHAEMAGVFKKIQGTINSWGVHAGGILVSDKPLTGMLPLRLNDGKLVSCWTEGLSGRELGEMGFLKLDLLAIETLDIIEEAIELVNQTRLRKGEEPITFDEIDYEHDMRALGRLERGMNQGVFQFETALALRVVKDMGGIRCFDDVGSLSTLMRPAALKNNFGKEYGERRDGAKEYFIPECMKDYIGNEYGLPIYQEHVYHFCKHLAGFSNVESYVLMKKMYKGKLKKKEDIEKWRKKFLDGCLMKVLHEEYDIVFDDGTTGHFTEFDKLKCTDDKEHTVKEIIENNLEVAD